MTGSAEQIKLITCLREDFLAMITELKFASNNDSMIFFFFEVIHYCVIYFVRKEKKWEFREKTIVKMIDGQNLHF